MENQAYEDERLRAQEQYRFSPYETTPSPSENSTLGPDMHVYEDISSGREETPCDPPASDGSQHEEPYEARALPDQRQSDGGEEAASVWSNGARDAASATTVALNRTLTLPLRRASPYNGIFDRSNSSVRVTKREKQTRRRERRRRRSLTDRDDGQGDPCSVENPAIRNERSGRSARRRLKKDCKHCRSIRSNDLETSNSLSSNSVPGTPTHTNVNPQVLSMGQDLLRLNFMPTSLQLPVRHDAEKRLGLPASVYSISKDLHDSPCRKLVDFPGGNVETTFPRILGTAEHRPVIFPEESRASMRINSIYSQDQHCREKDGPIFFSDPKDSAFQRAFSLPVRNQTVSSQNRVNLRRSVRGDPAPQPARLHKRRHGWTLHLATRTLDREGTGCTRTLVLILIVLLALLGLGAAALYIVFEPEQLQVIQQYLKSSSRGELTNSTLSEERVELLLERENETSSIKDISVSSRANPPMEFFEETTTTELVEVTDGPTTNSTRYCDDCLPGEVCVGLVDDDVPICRIGLDPKDPTGCAGLCLINKQRCHRLDVDAFRCVDIEHYCLDDEWTCLNTLCIPLDKRCDGHMNCYDHSDEYNCVCDHQTHFQCGNETSCLPLERRCDGKIDCWDATDEINCTLACPLESEFTCSNGQCILKARFCDGLVDCADESDEPHGCQGRCNKHEFTCQNSRCITKGMKCNGIDDCGDGTDELHCKDRLLYK
ncbi:uncharacterized protein [Prorops nasuta]|uniref:uncharacterized protein isoform X2 n=1 Tax=Prorops nasuta TaxID=863751 RepID=UPI0034CE65FF